MDTRHLVDPEVWPIVGLLPVLEFDADTLAATREGFASFAPPVEPPIAADVRTTRRADGSEIELYVFDPAPGAQGRAALCHIHGGGMILGSARDQQLGPSSMAAALGIPVVSVEYRLAPEAKWPAAPDDAEAAARWVAANGAMLGRSATSLILTGDSAGGTLTLLTALALRNKPAAAPVALMIPLYPMADGSKSYPSSRQFADGYGLSSADSAYYDHAYAPDKSSPRHSALLADLAGLPPTVLVAAGLDPLRDGDRAFAGKLASAGVPVSYYEVPGMIHGFATYRRGIASAQGELEHIMGLARAMLAKAPVK